MQEVDAVCDRVLMLRDWRPALDQSLSELHDSRTLLLRTSATGQSLATDLNHLPQIASLEESRPGDGPLRFSVHLHPNVDMDSAANEVAQCVIRAGIKLYQLETLTRDLDSVFREVYRNGD